jgi:hypothetical protein
MTITPDLLNLTKEQTFSSVAKGTANLPIALDAAYPAGGYPVTSLELFGADGFTFRLLSGIATNAAKSRYFNILHDVPNSKLILMDPLTGRENVTANLALFTAYCTFHRW